MIAFDRSTGRWSGDVPDGAWPPPLLPDGTPNAEGRRAFIMLPDGLARLYAPSLADGPLPEHYEPLESPVENGLSPRRTSPVLHVWRPEEIGTVDRYPIVATTCRVTEHWLSGRHIAEPALAGRVGALGVRRDQQATRQREGQSPTATM